MRKSKTYKLNNEYGRIHCLQLRCICWHILLHIRDRWNILFTFLVLIPAVLLPAAFFFLVFFLVTFWSLVLTIGSGIGVGAIELLGEVTHLGKSLSTTSDDSWVEFCCWGWVASDILAAADILFQDQWTSPFVRSDDWCQLMPRFTILLQTEKTVYFSSV